MQVSVVIPCHNAGPWIGETLRSVAAQTRPPHEIIVVDDASADDSVEQIRHCGVEVRLIRAQFRNAAAARNAGIEAASGDWIALLDADDLWYPNHLERAAEVLAGSNDVAYRAVYDELNSGGEPRPLTRVQPLTETRSGITHCEYIQLEDRELCFGHSSCVISRKRLREIGGYDVSQVRRHDIDMWLRLIAGKTWAWDAVPTIAYRVDTPGSISRNYIECEYYYLKALIRNCEQYRSPAMDSMLTKIARRVMTLGFTDGTTEQYKRAYRIASPYLPPKIRIAYALAGMAPPLARMLIRYKRMMFSWRTGHRLPEMMSPAPVR